MPRPTPSPADPLRDAFDAFRDFADRKDVPLLPGILAETKHSMPMVAYGPLDDDSAETEPRATMEALTTTLDRLDIALAVADTLVLTADWWQDEVAECEDRLARFKDLGEGVDPETEHRMEVVLDGLRALKVRIGQIALLHVWVITRNPAVVVEWLDTAAWKEALDDAESSVRTPVPTDDEWRARTSPEAQARQLEYEARDKERREWAPGPRRAKTARRLAEHPEFHRCKREADRVHLLRTMLGEEAPADQYLMKEISRDAGAIYRLEIAKTSR